MVNGWHNAGWLNPLPLPGMKYPFSSANSGGIIACEKRAKGDDGIGKIPSGNASAVKKWGDDNLGKPALPDVINIYMRNVKASEILVRQWSPFVGKANQ